MWQNAYVYANFTKNYIKESCELVFAELRQRGIGIYMSRDNNRIKFKNVNYENMNKIMSVCDIAVILGGDGTILSIANKLAPANIPILGINLGRLGFLAAIERKDIKKSFDKLFSGKYSMQKRSMLTCSLVADNKIIKSAHALNDVVISRGTMSRLIDVEVSFNNQPATHYIADGLIISTPTGSTAYSLSAGGPIVDPDVDVMLVSPICPHMLNARPLIIPSKTDVTLNLGNEYRKNALVSIDGKNTFSLDDSSYLKVTKSDCVATLIQIDGRDFYGVLNKKLTDRGAE